jgi:hypothetical protein
VVLPAGLLSAFADRAFRVDAFLFGRFGQLVRIEVRVRQVRVADDDLADLCRRNRALVDPHAVALRVGLLLLRPLLLGHHAQRLELERDLRVDLAPERELHEVEDVVRFGRMNRFWYAMIVSS